ncbi:CDKN2A-interacting protein [Engraulis encrasicolus]|uniref:CDKN2A-interacting protein n=1 Tax=Engraulis encrasicolus TaxID=184585 RepID=UPI002FD6E3F8
MAEEGPGDDIVAEYLGQNRHLVEWVESLRGICETNKQWLARREFLLRNMEAFPNVEPGVASDSLDKLISLSMVWANHVFLGCRYPQPVMERITEMGEGIKVQDAPVRTTRDEIMAKMKRGAASDGSSDSGGKKSKAARWGPEADAPATHQPFFNRLYKAVAWKLVSEGGFGGPNLDHYEVLRGCVETSKASLTCVIVPLKDIPDLPAARAQREGQVCELRVQTVYLGTGYGRDDAAARAMAAKEALKAFQGRKVTVKLCRRRFQGRDVEDVVLLDDQTRGGNTFPPALSYPFQPDESSGS